MKVTARSFAQVQDGVDQAWSTHAAAGRARALNAMRAIGSPQMSDAMNRRSAIATAATAAAAVPLAAVADGASSPTVRERARVIYGSRVARLVGASNEQIVEEANTFQLFTTGAYRSDVASKETKKQLLALGKKAVDSAKAGDSSAAQDAVNKFVKLGEIRTLDTVDGSIFNPKQRRNPGAPTTKDLEDQMGSRKSALYGPK